MDVTLNLLEQMYLSVKLQQLLTYVFALGASGRRPVSWH